MERIGQPCVPGRRSRRGALAALGVALLLAVAPGVRTEAWRPAGAAAAAEAVPMHALLQVIAAWTATELQLEVPEELPRVVFSAPDRMKELRYGSVDESVEAADVVALYEIDSRTIHLATGWTGGTPAELSVLVHEMVHHVQEVAGVGFSCSGAREAAAYELQARWLEQFGLDLFEEFELNALAVALITSCGM